jgi:methionine-rich copper-binding protein CopC
MSRFSRPLAVLTPFALAALVTATAAQSSFEADAGPDRFVVPPETSLELVGAVRGVKVSEVPSGIDVTWTQVSGPAAVIQDADTFTPTVIPSRPGTLRLRLEVHAPHYGTTSDDVIVRVFGARQDAEVSGTARKWHKLVLTFTHSATLSETSAINPFVDLRLSVQLYHPESGTLYNVPGFFAADGDAAETGASAGKRWRVNFTPDHAGTWYYLASFRSGNLVALNPSPLAGQPTSFDGANGSVFVECTDPDAPGFLSAGRLEYVGGHYLRFAETHASFLKNGAGSPENLLGYYEFDGTSDQGGTSNGLNNGGSFDGLHHFNAHLGDYVDRGVPLWQGGKGRRLFGAISYLASRGVNSLYALTYNVDGGDGQEVWPWFPSTDKLRFDVSKLAQWERLLDHMTREGVVWHAVTQELENDHVLDGGNLGVQRRLYYRELVARFAYAPGLVWNLGEENTNSTEQRMAFADYLHELDPYDHPISLHNVVGDLFGTVLPLLGTHLELVSIQGDPVQTPARAQQLVQASADAGRPWVVNFDEQTPASDGVVPDAVDFWHDLIRRESLWPMLLGQGGGCEWYFGYGYPNDDLDCEDFRSRDNLWRIAARSLDFVREHVPFDEMEYADGLTSGNGASVLAKPGEFYLVYLPFGGPVTLDLGGSNEPLSVSWFDARNGGALVDGTQTEVVGPGTVPLGAPPGSGDWVALVRRKADSPPEIESITVEPASFSGGEDFSVQVHARDPNGPEDVLTASAEVRDPSGGLVTTLPLAARGGSLYSYYLPDAAPLAPGTWQLVVTVVDSTGASVSGSASFEAR